MRNFFAMVGLAVVAFFGLGWYFGWYTVALQPGTDGRQRISLDLDTKKIAADTETAVGRITEAKNGKTITAKDEATRLIGEFVGPPAPKATDATAN